MNADDLKITETIEHFVRQAKRYTSRIDAGVYDHMTVFEFSNMVTATKNEAQLAIHGISMLLIKSGMSDPDADHRHTHEIDDIAKDAIKRFMARKEEKQA